MQKPSLIVKDIIVKTPDKTVLDGISFSLLLNEHLAILGNSESGKTTLAKALSGKIHFSGTVFAGCNAGTATYTGCCCKSFISIFFFNGNSICINGITGVY